MYNDTRAGTFSNIPDPVADLAKAAKVYDPSKGWKATAQPVAGATVADYHEMATQAEPALQAEMMSYCKERGLKPVLVPHAEFRDNYEQSRALFREWFNDYCKRTGQDQHADVMIMTRVKTLASAERKTSDDPTIADRQKDYLAGMFLHLNEHATPRAKKDSLSRFIKALDDIENDPRTIARNNLFNTPLKHGYRGHKAAWQIEVPHGETMGGLPLVVSVKSEPECMMPMDKMTRHCMNVTRETSASQATWWDRCVGNAMSTTKEFFRSAHSHMGRIERRPESLNGLSRRLYDYCYAAEGFNSLLSDKAREEHAPMTLTALRVVLRTANDSFKGRDLEKTVLETGVLPPERDARNLRLIRGGRQVS